jgi:hypothetical protein
LVGKPKGKRPFERPRRRLEDNVKINVEEVVRVIWIGLIWLRIGTGGGHL